MTPQEKLKEIEDRVNETKGSTYEAHYQVSWLIARVKELEGALGYIVDHEWAKDKPKWANEFIVVARKALKGES